VYALKARSVSLMNHTTSSIDQSDGSVGTFTGRGVSVVELAKAETLKYCINIKDTSI